MYNRSDVVSAPAGRKPIEPSRAASWTRALPLDPCFDAPATDKRALDGLLPAAEHGAQGGAKATGETMEVWLELFWGQDLQWVRQLATERDVYAGDPEGTHLPCDVVLPATKLGTSRTPLLLGGHPPRAVVPAGAHATLRCGHEPPRTLSELTAAGLAAELAELPGAFAVPLAPAAVLSIAWGDLRLEISLTGRERRASSGMRLASVLGGASPHTLASLLGHVGLLVAVAAFMPPLDPTSDDGLTDDQRYLVQQYLDAAAEIEQDERPTEQLATSEADDTEGGSGLRARYEEGAMGSTVSRARDGRWGAQGDPDNTDPRLARNRALADAETFGMIGMLNNGIGGHLDAPTVPWGGLTTDGRDPLDADGNIWGSSIGPAAGAGGLGLSGIGEGGGGRGEGIGMGSIGTYGHGSGSGFDQGFGHGHGRLRGRGHQSRAPRVRRGPIQLSGRLPPEVIQRIVRGNFGRFRGCYERGLQNNPALAGRLTVSFIIGHEGRVAQASSAGDLPDAGVASCVTRAFSGLTFPQPDGGVVTVRYPIVFSPGA